MAARALLLSAAFSGAAATITLPSHFASAMVLQRGAPIRLWGWAGSPVTVTYRGLALPPASPDATGRFAVTLPAQTGNATPDAVSLVEASGASLELEDVVVGDVFVCSGQSNMAIPVSWTAYYADVLARADALGPRLRMLAVAQLDAYTNATVPADNFTAAIPWVRAGAETAGAMSATCYHFGAAVATAYPDLAVGIVGSSWGGVTIQVWMSPTALATCGASTTAEPARAPAVVAAAERAVSGAVGASPLKPSCLYNSMLHPLLSIPITAIVWYQ